MYRMKKNRAPEERNRPRAGKSPAEIPPEQNRSHLTEPTWVENMIYLTGVLLRGEHPDEASDEDNPPKTEAA
jgi:hypothetical protein